MENAVKTRLSWGGGQGNLSTITGIGTGSEPFRAAERRTIKQGFTLAEVLITLGIIGVVAAMTLPSVIGHYRASIFESQLKKAYSTLQNINMQLVSREISPYYDYDISLKGTEILDKQTSDIASYINGAELCDSSKKLNVIENIKFNKY